MRGIVAWMLVFVGMLVVTGSVSAFTSTFQDSEDYTDVGCYSSPGVPASGSYYNSTGGNSYSCRGQTMNKVAGIYNYAAATSLGSKLDVNFYNSAGVYMETSYDTTTGPGRYEVKIEADGRSYLYRNGAWMTRTTVMPSVPAYIGFNGGSIGVDDVVYGSTDNRYIFGVPEQGFFVKKDMITPAASGLYYPNGTLQASANNFTTTWGFTADNTSRTVVLKHKSSNVNYASMATTAGTESGIWYVPVSALTGGAPYGQYVITIEGCGAESKPIWYLAYGASISYDKTIYAQQDTADITYAVSSGGYWDTATYDYKIGIMNAYGTFINNQTIVSQSGTVSYTFDTGDDPDVYYAMMIATPKAGGSEIWMNYDYATLTQYVTFRGWVNNAQTMLPVSGAIVNISQGSIITSVTTISDGNYTATGYSTGTPLILNVTATGYKIYNVSLTPMAAKIINLNFTINQTILSSPFSIGGVARTGTYSSTTGVITEGYGQPISNADIVIQNVTNGEYYQVTTNMAGYYLADQNSTPAIVLNSTRLYDLWGSKTGYTNSTVYKPVAP